MKTLLETHRTLMTLTLSGGTALLALLFRPMVSIFPSAWVIELGVILTGCAALVLGVISTLGSSFGMPQALGGLLILTGIIILVL